jgi:glycerophosphoryl diester phosphodiesterase
MMMQLRLAVIFTAILVNGFAQMPPATPLMRKPAICGHRGGFYDELPENSLAAFSYTVQHASITPVIIEFDVRESKDGTLYIMHDETVDRTTSGSGRIEELEDVYLNELKLKNSQGDTINEHVLTYESLLAFAGKNNVILMHDVKADVWDKCISLLKKYDLEKRSIMLTFTPADFKRVTGLSKRVRTSMLVRDERDADLIRSSRVPYKNLIAYVTKDVKQEVIDELNQKKISIMTDVSEHVKKQTVPFDYSIYKDLVISKKLDILITDFPVEVSRMMNNR